MKKQKKAIAIIATLGLLIGCGEDTNKDQKESEEAKNKPTNGVTSNAGSDPLKSDMPDASPILLTGMLKSEGMSLTQDEDVQVESCEQYGEYGIFGLPFGAACTIGPMVGELLYGGEADTNNDGIVSCNDYDPSKKDAGVLFGMLCDETVRAHDQIVTARWTDEAENKDFALSFEDFNPEDDFDVTGSWTATAVVGGRFPANVSVYHGPTNSDLTPVVGLDLRDTINGEVYLDTSSMGLGMKGQIKYSGKTNVANCFESPSKETCHWQEISLVGLEEPGPDRLVPAMELRILADGKKNSSIAVIEGQIRLNEAWAAAWFEDIEPLKATRTIYFKTATHDDQAWGSFSFLNEAGELIEAKDENGFDISLFAQNGLGAEGDGFCVGADTGDKPVACDKVDRNRFADLWQGVDATQTLPADYDLPLSFPAAPVTYGFVTK